MLYYHYIIFGKNCMGAQMINERIKNFLKDLAELTKQHGIEIGGCGCCGSPYLDDTKTLQTLATDLWYYNREYKVIENGKED